MEIDSRSIECKLSVIIFRHNSALVVHAMDNKKKESQECQRKYPELGEFNMGPFVWIKHEFTPPRHNTN